jgi:condensin complex subunit 2
MRKVTTSQHTMRKVTTEGVRVQAKYARHVKHVDVLSLKAGVWRELQRAAPPPAAPPDGAAAQAEPPGVQFQDVVRGLRSGDGGAVADLSVHLCFICLLHLANENELTVKSTPAMDELVVWA